MNLSDAVFTVLDVETTGFDPKVDRICQIGWVRVGKANGQWCLMGVATEFLCNPGIQIPATASAVHHITDRMVRDALSPSTVASEALVQEPFAAHNEAFDRGFITAALGGIEMPPWLCTMRLAKHLYPTAPSYSNQALRYWLGYEEIKFIGHSQAHRAGFDAAVTATILCHMLNFIDASAAANPEIVSVDTLIAFAQSPVVLNGKLGFGKHFDKTWAEVPIDYLQWMIRENEVSLRRDGKDAWDRDTLFTIDRLLRRQ